jgi:hypothetical protein
MIDSILKFFNSLSPVVAAALISAAVAIATSVVTLTLVAPLRYLLDKRSVSHRLKTEYEYEQRKNLGGLIGQFRGQMLEAAEIVNHRMFNLYENESEGWLTLKGNYSKPGYYFCSMVFRFLSLYSLVRRFQAEALFIDPRIAGETDLEFLKYAKAFEWVATDVELFEGICYDRSQATDHFFRDELRAICDSCVINGKFVGIDEFGRYISEPDSSQLHPVLWFFDGLNSSESRPRWDRMVSLHLLTMAFMNRFGYDMQKSTRKQFSEVSARIRHAEVRLNLAAWLPRLGLKEQKEIKLLRGVLTGE